MSGYTLVAAPYTKIRDFHVDLEMAQPRFSAMGTLLALRLKGEIILVRNKDGKLLGKLPGRTILFAADDNHVVTIGEKVRVFKVTGK